jgi:serine/threonine protein kinase
MHHGTERTLLFGVLASQLGFIRRDTLIAGMRAWSLDKTEPFEQILVENKYLTRDRCALLERLVDNHIKQHGDDPQRSLATVLMLDATIQDLGQINDPDLQSTLAPHSLRSDETTDEISGRLGGGTGTAPGMGPRFQILRPHARGGLGKVSVALDRELHREVALKELQERFVNDSQSRARFLLEGEITGRLEHPGIVPIYGMSQHSDGRPYYAMRFVEGEDLESAIRRFHRAGEPGREPGERDREFRKLLRRFLDVCNAIEYAHSRGVLHRDLKPANIMLGKFGETLVVDWGLAKLLGQPDVESTAADPPLQVGPGRSPDQTLAGRAIGTWQYMSPEQAAGRLDLLSPASDVYSLGATLYQLLTNRVPFEGASVDTISQSIQAGQFLPPAEVKPNVPAALEAICLKAMAREPNNRFASARALADELEEWLADEPISAYRDAVASHEARVRAHPATPRYQEALARVRSNYGNALHFLGRNEEAVPVHRQAIDELQALVDHFPHTLGYREKLAVAFSNLGWVLKVLGRPEEAEAAYRAALAEYNSLSKFQPDLVASVIPGLSGLFAAQGWVFDRKPPSHSHDAGIPPNPWGSISRVPLDDEAEGLPTATSKPSSPRSGEVQQADLEESAILPRLRPPASPDLKPDTVIGSRKKKGLKTRKKNGLSVREVRKRIGLIGLFLVIFITVLFIYLIFSTFVGIFSRPRKGKPVGWEHERNRAVIIVSDTTATTAAGHASP